MHRESKGQLSVLLAGGTEKTAKLEKKQSGEGTRWIAPRKRGKEDASVDSGDEIVEKTNCPATRESSGRKKRRVPGGESEPAHALRRQSGEEKECSKRASDLYERTARGER